MKNPLDYFYSLPFNERAKIRRLAEQALEDYDYEMEDDDPVRTIEDYLSDAAGGWLKTYLDRTNPNWAKPDTDPEPTTWWQDQDVFTRLGSTAAAKQRGNNFIEWAGDGDLYSANARIFLQKGASEADVEDAFDAWVESPQGRADITRRAREADPEGAQARDDKLGEKKPPIGGGADDGDGDDAPDDTIATSEGPVIITDDSGVEDRDYSFQAVEERAAKAAEEFMGLGVRGRTGEYRGTGNRLGTSGYAALVPKDWIEYMALPTGNGEGQVPALVKAFFYNQAAQFRYSQYQPALKEAQRLLKVREDQLEDFKNQQRDTPLSEREAQVKAYENDIVKLKGDVQSYTTFLDRINKSIESSAKQYKNIWHGGDYLGTFDVSQEILVRDRNYWATDDGSVKTIENIKAATKAFTDGTDGDGVDPSIRKAIKDADAAGGADDFNKVVAELGAEGTSDPFLESRSLAQQFQDPSAVWQRLGLTGQLLQRPGAVEGDPRVGVNIQELSPFAQAAFRDYYGRVVEPEYALQLGQQAQAGTPAEQLQGFEAFARQAPGTFGIRQGGTAESQARLQAAQQDLIKTLQDQTMVDDPFRAQLMGYFDQTGGIEDARNTRLLSALGAPTLSAISPIYRQSAMDRMARNLANLQATRPEQTLLSFFTDQPAVLPDYSKATTDFTIGGV